MGTEEKEMREVLRGFAAERARGGVRSGDPMKIVSEEEGVSVAAETGEIATDGARKKALIWRRRGDLVVKEGAADGGAPGGDEGVADEGGGG